MEFPISRGNNAGGDLCSPRRHFDSGVQIVSPPGDVFSSSSRTPAGDETQTLKAAAAPTREAGSDPGGMSPVFVVSGRK